MPISLLNSIGFIFSPSSCFDDFAPHSTGIFIGLQLFMLNSLKIVFA
jgi:hypothetical protein